MQNITIKNAVILVFKSNFISTSGVLYNRMASVVIIIIARKINIFLSICPLFTSSFNLFLSLYEIIIAHNEIAIFISTLYLIVAKTLSFKKNKIIPKIISTIISDKNIIKFIIKLVSIVFDNSSLNITL